MNTYLRSDKWLICGAHNFKPQAWPFSIHLRPSDQQLRDVISSFTAKTGFIHPESATASSSSAAAAKGHGKAKTKGGSRAKGPCAGKKN